MDMPESHVASPACDKAPIPGVRRARFNATVPGGTQDGGERATGCKLAAALAMIAGLPLTDTEKAEAVRRLLADHDANGKP